MARSVRRLKDRAWRALRKGQIERARKLYEELEELEPGEPAWPARLAEVHRQRDDREAQIAALVRAAERYAAAGLTAQAIATGKLVLGLEPGHTGIRERLLEMCDRRGVRPPRLLVATSHAAASPESAAPVAGEAAAPAPGPRPSASPRAETSGRAAADVRPGPAPPQGDFDAPLDEILLTEIVPDAQPAFAETGERERVAEIPLGPRGAADRSTAARGGHPHPLAVTPLFSSLSYDGLRELIDGSRLVRVAAGETVFHEGDPADALYVVVQGAVVPVAEGEQRRRLAVLEEGAFFGEIGLVTDRPRNATVEALVDTQLLAIGRPLMWELLQRDDRIFRELLGFVRDRLIDRLVQTSPLFAALARAEREDLADHFRFLEVPDGSSIVVEGQPSGGLYVLLAGSMDVTRRERRSSGPRHAGEPKCVATLEPGEFFGEMSLLSGAPAVASVTARGKCWMVALGEHLFHAWAERSPGLERVVAEVADERWRSHA